MKLAEFQVLSEPRKKVIGLAKRECVNSWRPTRDEAWWWLWIPFVYAASIIAIYHIESDLYYSWILPEGFGVLEYSQFLLATSGLVVATRLYLRPYVRAWPLIKWSVLVFALCCFYIAGEEQSWGQHFFGWSTPESWSRLNKQNETNLHNAFNLANYLPSAALELGVAVGGIIMPIYQYLVGSFTHGLLELFAPPSELMPTALCAAGFKYAKVAGPDDVSPLLVPIPNEAVETFLYLFMFYYLVVFARRVSAMERVSLHVT